MSLARTLYPWHSWLGLSLGPVVCTLCISGSLAVFKDELHAWAASVLSEPAPIPPLDEALARFAAALDSDQPLRRLELPVRGRGYEIRTVDGQRFRLDADGQVVPVRHAQGIADFLVNYHTRLFMGHAGRWVVGGIGIAFLASIFTGLLIHRHLLRQLVVLRWRIDNPRLTYSDTHKAVGIWGLPFHVLIAGTGAWLGLYALLVSDDALAPAAPRGDLPCGERVQVSCLVAETRSRIPGFEPVFVDFRDLGQAEGRIEVRGNLPAQLVRRHEAGAVFSATIGALITLDSPAQMPVARRLDLATAPLHFGDFGGAFVRWLYALLGLLGTVLALTGTLMRSLRGNAAEKARRWREVRVIISTAGGNIFATLALPLLAVLASADIGPGFGGSMRLADLLTSRMAPALPVFLGLWLLATLFLVRQRTLWRIGIATLIGSGLLCLLAPVSALVLRTVHGLPAMSLNLPEVTISLALCGVGLLAAGLWVRRKHFLWSRPTATQPETWT